MRCAWRTFTTVCPRIMLLKWLARFNGVQQRVRVHGRRRGFGQQFDVVLCDIEGDEGPPACP